MGVYSNPSKFQSGVDPCHGKAYCKMRNRGIPHPEFRIFLKCWVKSRGISMICECIGSFIFALASYGMTNKIVIRIACTHTSNLCESRMARPPNILHQGQYSSVSNFAWLHPPMTSLFVRRSSVRVSLLYCTPGVGAACMVWVSIWSRANSSTYNLLAAR